MGGTRASTDSDTVLEKPDTRPSDKEAPPSLAGQASLSGSNATVINSPVAALDHAEIVRTRHMAVVGIGVAIAGALTIPLLPGGYVTTRILIGTIGIAIIGMLYMLYRT